MRPDIRATLAWVCPLLAVMLSAPGCRQSTAVQPFPSPPVPIGWTWHTGDVFRYNTWRMDSLGFFLDATPFTSSRTVLATGLVHAGRSGVTAMVDSIPGTGGTARVDTLFFVLSAEGDLLQLGLIHMLGIRYGWGDFAEGWDRIAGLSAGPGSTWLVQDGDFVSGLVGSDAPDPLYVTVPVNGAMTLATAQACEIDSGGMFLFSFWLSESPAAFLRLVEAGTNRMPGFYRSIASISVTR